MSYQKLGDLVMKLLRETKAGKVQWEETVDQGQYQASFADYSVQISTAPNAEDHRDTDYVINIFDEEGNRVESFRDIDLTTLSAPPGPTGFYLAMREIHETARRMALGSEKIINEIISILDNDEDEIPF